MQFSQAHGIFVEIAWNFTCWSAVCGIRKWQISNAKILLASLVSTVPAPTSSTVSAKEKEGSGWVTAAKWGVVRGWLFSVGSSPVLAGLGTTCKLKHILPCQIRCQQCEYSVTKSVKPGYFCLLEPRRSFISILYIQHVTCKLLSVWWISQQSLQVSYHMWAHSVALSMVCSWPLFL